MLNKLTPREKVMLTSRSLRASSSLQILLAERKLKQEEEVQAITARKQEGLRVDVMVPQPARQKQSLQTTISYKEPSVEGSLSKVQIVLKRGPTA